MLSVAARRARSLRPLVAPARRARSSRPLVTPGAAEGSRKSARLSSPGGRTTYAFDHGEVSQSSQVGFNHHITKPHRVTPHHLRWAKARTTPVDVSTETKCRCQGHGSSRATWHINMCVPIGDSTREMASDSRRHHLAFSVKVAWSLLADLVLSVEAEIERRPPHAASAFLARAVFF